MSDYRYLRLLKPSTSLRLIEILPAVEGKDIKCTIRTYPNMKSQPYQALSYTWGDPEAKVRITLNGKRFYVTANLESALRSLRRRRGDVISSQLPFWIDAMCINQEDTEERDEQVRRMKSIYRDAERVVIWLGDYEDPGDEKLQINSRQWGIERLEECTESVAKQVAGNLYFWIEVLSRQKQSQHAAVIFGPLNALGNPQFWAQVSRLFQRPWFERLWIIQELGVARRAIGMWGKIAIRWECLERIASYILRPGSYQLGLPPPDILKLFPLLGAHRITQVSLKTMLNLDTNNILTVLHNTQTTKCSDPRDRLYAILGIVSDTADVDIDYSISVQEVYRNWAEKRIRRTNTLDILSACADSGRSGDLPSWVPDLRSPFGHDRHLWMWTHLTGPNTLGTAHSSGQNMISECKSLAFSQDGREVSIEGRFISSIRFITTAADAVKNLQDPTDLKPRLLEIIVRWKHQMSSQLDASYLDLFHQALLRKFPWIHDGTFDKNNIAWANMKNEFDVWRGVLPIPEASDIWHAAIANFERSLFSKIHGCQMFLTKTVACFGIVAANANVIPGDEVAFLKGGLTPFVLRRISATPATKYRLITPCYLDGGMDCIMSGPLGGVLGRAWNDNPLSQIITLV